MCRRYRLHRPLAIGGGRGSGRIFAVVGLRRMQQVPLPSGFVLSSADPAPCRAVGECEGQLP